MRLPKGCHFWRIYQNVPYGTLSYTHYKEAIIVKDSSTIQDPL